MLAEGRLCSSSLIHVTWITNQRAVAARFAKRFTLRMVFICVNRDFAPD